MEPGEGPGRLGSAGGGPGRPVPSRGEETPRAFRGGAGLASAFGRYLRPGQPRAGA